MTKSTYYMHPSKPKPEKVLVICYRVWTMGFQVKQIMNGIYTHGHESKDVITASQ